MNATTKHDVCQISRPLAPEDVQPEQYVFVFHIVEELLPFWCLDENNWKKIEPLHFVLMPGREVAPLRVVEVCVPFVLVEQPDGNHRTLDLRRHRLARVSDRFGQRAFKRLRRKVKREET